MRLEEGSWQAEAVRSQLAAGEKLRWMGAPDPWRSMGPRVPSFLWGLVLAAMVGGAGFGAAAFTHQPIVGAVVALVFVPFNFFALRGLTSPLRGWMAARATVYAVSDRRLIFLYGRRNPRVESFDAPMLPVVQSLPRGEGGSLVFPTVALSTQVAKLNGGHKSAYQALGLYHLTERDAAESALSQLRAQVPAGTGRPKGSELGLHLVLPWPRGFDGRRLDPDEALKALLMRDEKVRWSTGPQAPSPDSVKSAMLSGGVLTIFALVIASQTLGLGLPLSGECVVGGVLGCMALGGLYLLAAPKWMPVHMSNIRYAVTDRRLVVMQPKGLSKLTLASYVPPSLHITRVTTTPDGGTLQVRCDDYVYVNRVYDQQTRRYSTQTHLAPGSLLQGLPDLEAAQDAIIALQAGTPLEQAMTVPQAPVQSAVLEQTVPALPDAAPLVAALQSFTRPEDFPPQLLQPGEEVRWLGRPAPQLKAWHIVIGFLGTLPLLQAVLSVIGALFHGDLLDLFSANAGWPLLGLAFLAAAWPWAYHLTARSTLYAVTNQRALALMGSPAGQQMRVFPPATLATRVRVERVDGSGDLTFSPDAMPATKRTALSGSGAATAQPVWKYVTEVLVMTMPFTKGFIAVPHLEEAETAIERLLAEPAGQPL